MNAWFWLLSLKAKDRFEGIGIDRRIILQSSIIKAVARCGLCSLVSATAEWQAVLSKEWTFRFSQ
jgi:hypothetical protein